MIEGMCDYCRKNAWVNTAVVFERYKTATQIARRQLCAECFEVAEFVEEPVKGRRAIPVHKTKLYGSWSGGDDDASRALDEDR